MSNTDLNTGMTEPTLHIRLFGAMEITVNGCPIPRTRTRTEAWILAMLVVRGGREIQRSEVAGTFWPDSDEQQALNNLRRSLSNLRDVLGAEAWRLHSASRSTIRMNLNGAWCDLERFDTAYKRGGPDDFRTATTLYAGPLLSGCDEGWAQPERTDREQKYQHALESLASEAMKSGDANHAVSLLRKAVLVDPARESAQHALMTAIARTGDLAELIRAFRAYETFFRVELDSDLDDRTIALYESLRLEIRSPRDASSTQSTPEAASRPLPQPLTRFHGRDAEIDQLVHLICAEGSRLVTILGLSGCGKSRIALETGLRMQKHTDRKVWFVPLADLRDAQLIPAAICMAVCPETREREDPVSTVASHLGDGPALLILDNFEQFGPDGAAIIQRLLNALPNALLLLTSQRPVGLSGEREFALNPLDTPTEPLTAEQALEFPSVRLFVDRVQARRSGFQLTEHNFQDVARLCRQLDGLPLAIELAAGWARLLTPRRMLAELSNRFEFLVGTQTDIPVRHRSMRGALETSFALIEESARQFLASLSIFRGGWSADGASVVCHEPRVVHSLNLLSELSMIVIDGEAEGQSEPRYRLLESVRDYCWEILPEEERRSLEKRHLDYYLALALTTGKNLKSEEQDGCLRLLDIETDNLRAALDRSIASHSDASLQLGSALTIYWRLRGRYNEGRRYLARALDACPESDPNTVGTCHVSLGQLTMFQGDFVEAARHFETGLELLRAAGDLQGQSAALNNLGIIARNQNRFEAARGYYEASLHIDEERNDRWGVAASLNNLGNMATSRGCHQEARALHERGLQIRRALGDRDSIAWSLYNLGNVHAHLKDLSMARSYFEESLQITRDLGDQQGIVLGLSGLCSLLISMGELKRAQPLLIELMQRIRQMEDKLTACHAIVMAAQFAAATGFAEVAVTLFSAASALRETIQFPMDEMDQQQERELLRNLESELSESTYSGRWATGQRIAWCEGIDHSIQLIEAWSP